MDYEYLGNLFEYGVREGVEEGMLRANDLSDERNIRRLRAQFAGQFMQAHIASADRVLDSDFIAATSVGQADALLLALGYELPKAEEQK